MAARDCAFAFLLLCPLAGAEDPPPEEPPGPVGKAPWAWVEEGDEALRAGDRERAVAAYKAAIDQEAADRAEQARTGVRSGHGYAVVVAAEPRASLGHAPATPPETRARIDALIRILLDPFTEDRDAEAAAKDLVAIGAPMLHPLIARMVQERDRLEGKPTLEDDLRMTALRRGDACLRALDPFLDAVGKERIAAGSDRAHVSFVLGVHFARSGSVWGWDLPSVYDPPPDLPHLDSTPADLRMEIDRLVAVMMDPDAGRDSLTARDRLAAIGKPAFPRVLGAMAGAVSILTDEDTMEERLLESSLYLADQCLRQMDGYCVAKNYQPIRPGSDKKYARYVLKIHYKRWLTFLKDKDEMPGPYTGGGEEEK